MDMSKYSENLSDFAKEILKNGYGYRDEFLYGEGYTDFAEVLEHETLELWNTDIYETMESVYGITLPYSTEEDLDEDERQENNIAILTFVKERLGCEKVYCKWLCTTKEDVIEIYGASEDSVEQWSINENIMIGSDGNCPDGVLILSDKEICRGD